jgi:phage regulator Rha-like protein
LIPLDSVILVTFKIKGIPIPIKIASTNEPTREQILKKITDLANGYDLSGEIQFKKLLKENGHKMYIYEIGEKKCMVLVEKLEKIKEFEEIDS